MGDEPKAIYSCTQLELYSMCDLICDNLTADLAAFVLKKSKYTAAYVTARRAQIQACRDMPDEDTRNYDFKQLRIDLKGIGDICLGNFQDLKMYINDWRDTKPEQEAAYIAAGQNLYKTAAKGDWEDLQGMNNTMSLFVNGNDAQLQAEGYMPAAFSSKVETDRDAFAVKYNAFKTARETSVATAAKVIANNELHLEFSKINDDGQRVFANNVEMRKRYMWTELLLIVSPPGAASLNVRLKRDVDFTAIAGAQVKIQRTGFAAVTKETDENGEAEMPNIDAGVYTVTVTIGTEPVRTFTKDVNVGTNARMELVIPKV